MGSYVPGEELVALADAEVLDELLLDDEEDLAALGEALLLEAEADALEEVAPASEDVPDEVSTF